MYSNDIINLLDFKDKNVKIDNFVFAGDVSYCYISFPVIPHSCPSCGKSTTYIKDYRPTSTINHGIFRGKQLFIRYKKRRYKCPNCNKVFLEKNNIVSKFCKTTNSLRSQILLELPQKSSFKDIAERNKVCSSTVIRLLHKFASFSKPSHLPEVLCIDEFAAHTKNGKYATSIVDFYKGKIFDVLKDRKVKTLLDYFNSFPLNERKKVQYVTIDMYQHFKSAIKQCFPNAKIIADKFHIFQLVTKSFNSIRINILKNLDKKSLQYRLIKKNWKLLIKHYQDLNDSVYFYNYTLKKHLTNKNIVDICLSFSDELTEAHAIKEEFYNLFDLLSNPYSTKESRKKYLDDILLLLKNSKFYQYQNVYNSFRRWKNEILNSLTKPNSENIIFSNAKVEGFNNYIKVIKRIAFGFRSFKNLRARILLSTRSNCIIS